MTEDPLLTIEEAAQFTSLSSKTIRRLVGSRELEHIRIGRSIRIRTSALEAYLEARTVRPLWLEEEVA